MPRATMKYLIVAAAVVTIVLCPETRALAQGNQAATDPRIEAALGRARSNGVPVALLESKIAEGRAKGVPTDRIAVAVERREAALERASQVLKGQLQVAAADLSVAADAIEMGVNDAVLKAVAESASSSRRAVAIAALSALVERGTAPDTALARVRDALKRGPDALETLGADTNGRSGNANGQGRGASSSSGRGEGSAGRGQGSAGRGAATPGPPESVPAPGGQSQPRKPDTPNGSNGRGNGRSGH